MTGVVLIDNINGTYTKPNFGFSLVRFWLALGREG
jgi:hypothetical protein